MADRTADILFEYLRGILYAPEKASLDLEQLPEEWKTFGEGMQYLGTCIAEQKAFGRSLANGKLDVEPPRGDNLIASPLVAVQAALRHTVWRMRRTAEGDYTQRMEFLGDFADAFNGMCSLIETSHEALEKQNKELEQIEALFLTMTSNMDEWVLVMGKESREEHFMSKGLQTLWDKNPSLKEDMRSKLNWLADIGIPKVNWNFTCEIGRKKQYYSVISYLSTWKKTPAVVHLIEDVTERKQETEKQEKLLNEDFLTGLYSRRYGMKTIEEWAAQGKRFCIAFIDIDNLKYCNDRFGHEEGDRYICQVADTLRELPDSKVICRVGGDEFLVIHETVAAEELEEILEDKRRALIESGTERVYEKSFSYGAYCMNPEGTQTTSEVLREADLKMYQYKFRYKAEQAERRSKEQMETGNYQME